MGLGDAIERALSIVGITSARIERWLGIENCGCAERKEKLNQLGYWARRVISRGSTGMSNHLNDIMESDGTD